MYLRKWRVFCTVQYNYLLEYNFYKHLQRYMWLMSHFCISAWKPNLRSTSNIWKYSFWRHDPARFSDDARLFLQSYIRFYLPLFMQDRLVQSWLYFSKFPHSYLRAAQTNIFLEPLINSTGAAKVKTFAQRYTERSKEDRKHSWVYFQLRFDLACTGPWKTLQTRVKLHVLILNYSYSIHQLSIFVLFFCIVKKKVI